MELIIDFPGDSRVDAHFDGFDVPTDQPPGAAAPTPFALFLSSIGTCAGIYVLGFCRQRNLPTQGLLIIERVHNDSSTGMVDKIDLQIILPPGFPEKYRDSLVHAADLCKVKKHLEHPPVIEIKTTLAQPAL